MAAKRVVEVDFTGVESGNKFIHVPEGDYALEIKKIEPKKSEKGKYLNFHLELSKGPKSGNGKTISHTCSLMKQALWNLRNLLEACGRQVPSKAVKLDLDKLIGLKCAGSIVDDEYEGKKKSQIGAFFPLEDLGKTSDSGEDLEEAGTGEEAEESEEKEESEEDELFS